MPTTKHSTIIRLPPPNGDDGSLQLVVHVTHVIDVVSQTEPPVSLKTMLCHPQVILHWGQVVVSVKGISQGISAAPSKVLKSGCMRTLVDSVKLNKTKLGLEHISAPYEENSIVEFALSPKGLTDPPAQLPSMLLRRIELKVAWGRKMKKHTDPDVTEGTELDPFAPDSVNLPHRQQWSSAVMKIMLYHMLRRYPYVFGEWKADFLAEESLYQNISGSLCRMFLRTPNREFRKPGKEAFQELQMKSTGRIKNSWAALLALTDRSGIPIVSEADVAALRRAEDAEDELNTEDRFREVVSNSLSSLYTRTIRPGRKDYQVQSLDDVEEPVDFEEEDLDRTTATLFASSDDDLEYSFFPSSSLPPATPPTQEEMVLRGDSDDRDMIALLEALDPDHYGDFDLSPDDQMLLEEVHAIHDANRILRQRVRFSSAFPKYFPPGPPSILSSPPSFTSRSNSPHIELQLENYEAMLLEADEIDFDLHRADDDEHILSSPLSLSNPDPLSSPRLSMLDEEQDLWPIFHEEDLLLLSPSLSTSSGQGWSAMELDVIMGTVEQSESDRDSGLGEW